MELLPSAAPQSGGQTMRKSQVSLGRRRLIELMQSIHYGAIEGLSIQDREPVLDPAPNAIREIALGKDVGQHGARKLPDFELKAEVLELFALFDRERNITIDRVVVQAGLPLRLRVRISEEAA